MTERGEQRGYAVQSRAVPAGPQVVVREGNLHLPVYADGAQRMPRSRAPETRPAVFLDRDGVLVDDVHFLTEPDRLRILPRAVEALRGLQDRFYIIVVTNQSGIARGLLTEERLLEIHQVLIERLSAEGAFVDAIYYCPHLPGATVRAYDIECDCRKPKGGMLLRAETDWGIDLAGSTMLGDRPRDLDAGRAAGVRGIMIGLGGDGPAGPGAIAGDLGEAARMILATADREGVASDERGAIVARSGSSASKRGAV